MAETNGPFILGELYESMNIAPVANMLTNASDVAVSDATQSQDQSWEMSSDDPSYCESAGSDNSYQAPRRSNRKRTPSIKRRKPSIKRRKIAHPPGKTSTTCNLCKRWHSKCDGAQPCKRCTKAGRCQFNMLSLPPNYY